jgi:hypothetical protein
MKKEWNLSHRKYRKMSFLASLYSQVDAATQAKGRKVYQRHKVGYLEGDAHEVSADVRGTGDAYAVDVLREDNIVTATCSCAAFASTQAVCKHIWATLLAADAKSLLEGDDDHTDLVLLAGEVPEPDFGSDTAWVDEDDIGEPHLRLLNPPQSKAREMAHSPRTEPVPDWQKNLKALQAQVAHAPPSPYLHGRVPAGGQLIYVVELAETAQQQELSVSVPRRQRKQNGDWSKPKYESIDSNSIADLPDADDRKILSLLVGAKNQRYGYASYYGYSVGCRFSLSLALAETLLPMMCQTGRCYMRRSSSDELEPVAWDDGPAWTFLLKMTRPESGPRYRICGLLRRQEQTVDLTTAVMLLQNLVIWPDRISLFKLECSFNWVGYFCRQVCLEFPVAQKGAWLGQFLRLPDLPRIEWPEDLQIQEIEGSPRPCLRIQPIKDRWAPANMLEGKLSFEYAGQKVDADQAGPLFQPEANQLLRRDHQAEENARKALFDAGFVQRVEYVRNVPRLELKTRQLPKAVADLLTRGWHVEADGKLYRQPGKIDIEVTTGIDWFELHGEVQFDQTRVGLPELLAALKKGENTVVLGDGSLGMLPQEWLKKYGLLAGLGKAENGHLKFGRNQVGLLDALLAAQPEARCDTAFARARDELRHFEGVQPADPPDDFQGQLRGYQRDGLGWLHFLHQFGFGGCLADDMGLGKTVQVLGLLAGRSKQEPKPGPSLVVVPKSLIFNWQQEAARFTPGLRVLDHTGVGRQKPGPHFQDYDLILTTYGTLRRDALEFKDCKFDYCILDEAQAVKNAKSESAKAVRLLQANHRLTVTGTPVENHLGELWSLFEFLNPGMLGQASVFQLAGSGARNPEPETRELLARALRPFLLRRTKEQVAKDLPPKTEQTLYAEMEPPQRQLYDQLRDHYRQSLLAKVAQDGLAKSKIQILEALLRLRQAACHPGLIDKNRKGEPSAKLDLLLPQLTEVLDEGHKALVFSQFTSMLAIVRDRLDQEKIPYEYLDGRTRNRGDKVERFQNDPGCKLFLISLKAGGLGLNLTAAEYVFLLDPWWNPAVEAQAIDRTHRIGQTSPVFAYRLIVKDTVEEKVLELQKHKRDLADAILSADNSLIRSLGREDLELLLS